MLSEKLKVEPVVNIMSYTLKHVYSASKLTYMKLNVSHTLCVCVCVCVRACVRVCVCTS